MKVAANQIVIPKYSSSNTQHLLRTTNNFFLTTKLQHDLAMWGENTPTQIEMDRPPERNTRYLKMRRRFRSHRKDYFSVPNIVLGTHGMVRRLHAPLIPPWLRVRRFTSTMWVLVNCLLPACLEHPGPVTACLPAAPAVYSVLIRPGLAAHHAQTHSLARGVVGGKVVSARFKRPL